MLVSEVLAKAADLIEPEGKWTQGKLYRDSKNRETVIRKDACSYCMAGAIVEVGASLCGPWSEAWSFLDAMLPNGNFNPVAYYNDASNRTQTEVVAKLREAAALAKEQGK